MIINQPQVRDLRNVFVPTAGKIANDHLIRAHFWRALYDLGHGMGGFQRWYDTFKLCELLEGAQCLVICGIGVFRARVVP